MNAPNNNLKVKIWDLGPKRPEAPKAPVEPKGEAKSADFQVAMIEFEDALDAYKRELRAYGELKKQYDRWRETDGGACQLDMWAVDARDAKERDPERYVDVLPRSVKPGRQHEENQAREVQRRKDLAEAADRDPQFGKGVAA